MNAPASLTAAMQSTIETVYDLSTPSCVDDFVISDARVAERLDRYGRPNVEKLLVAQRDDVVAMSLFIDPDALQRLHASNPFQHLAEHNFNDFCTVLEGVSHFVYVACNAAVDKKVTLLELELQAEVDKYVVASLLLGRQSRRPPLRALWHRLFAGVRFADALTRAELERYACANRSARRYCHHIARRRSSGRRVVPQLRRFYRMPKIAKLAAC
ncbi:MAG: hypothetical protein AB8G17_13250 [Gammaproteobacteria bacterium]